MVGMMRHIFPLIILAVSGSAAWSCWSEIAPSAFALDCPVIVAGSIEEVVEAAPGGLRADDSAKIRIDAIFRNELTDLPLKIGDLFPVKMISKNNQLRTSTDLNYPLKTKAVWLVKLTSKGEFRIDIHPVQKQPYQLELKLKFGLRDKVMKAGKEAVPALANPNGTQSKAEWIVAMKRMDEERVKARAAHDFQQKAIRALAKRFADADELTDEVWKAYHHADIDVRRSVLQLSLHEQPMSGPRFAELARGVLQQEKDDNVRTHAVSQLAYCRDPGPKGVEVLASALRDKSPSVRLFACQSVKFRRYEQLAGQIMQMRSDPDQQVRAMAIETLEFWRMKAK
jgi:hypothetical protein